MAKKLTKAIEATVVTITEAVTGKVLKFDFATLPKDIQVKFGPFGLSHKLGDAAAGKEGEEAVAAIGKVFEGLMKSDWSVRVPAGEKITKSSLKEKMAGLSDKEQAVAAALLAKLGVKL